MVNLQCIYILYIIFWIYSGITQTVFDWEHVTHRIWKSVFLHLLGLFYNDFYKGFSSITRVHCGYFIRQNISIPLFTYFSKVLPMLSTLQILYAYFQVNFTQMNNNDTMDDGDNMNSLEKKKRPAPSAPATSNPASTKSTAPSSAHKRHAPPPPSAFGKNAKDLYEKVHNSYCASHDN